MIYEEQCYFVDCRRPSETRVPIKIFLCKHGHNGQKSRIKFNSSDHSDRVWIRPSQTTFKVFPYVGDMTQTGYRSRSKTVADRYRSYGNWKIEGKRAKSRQRMTYLNNKEWTNTANGNEIIQTCQKREAWKCMIVNASVHDT